jgi:hypothetical protein
MALPTFTKHPDDRADYDIRIVSNDNDTVASVDSVTVAPSGSLASDSSDISGATAKLWMTGGVALSDYIVTAAMTTTLGRVINKVFQINVRTS